MMIMNAASNAADSSIIAIYSMNAAIFAMIWTDDQIVNNVAFGSIVATCIFIFILPKKIG